jgi:hypothetical protein
MRGKRRGNNVTELTCIAPLKPGGADQLRALFATREERERQGERSPIERIGTIHYARWVILDNGKRLLFTSNFDGGLNDYLKEFAERDEMVLNAIFRFCKGWPGARPVEDFIKYVEEHQAPAAYYYAAYGRYTVGEVKRALYWKRKTEDFLKELGKPEGDKDRAIRQLIRELAKPTPWPLPEP